MESGWGYVFNQIAVVIAVIAVRHDYQSHKGQWKWQCLS